MEAAEELEKMGINIEVIDPQTLYPFDTDNVCGKSLQKTSKLLVVDEDLPGGGSAFILQKIIEAQNGYYSLMHSQKHFAAPNTGRHMGQTAITSANHHTMM
jgi:pyruvate/2-oxoglutarate/acetoin dehydrogenase E1 component